MGKDHLSEYEKFRERKEQLRDLVEPELTARIYVLTVSGLAAVAGDPNGTYFMR